MNIKTTTLALLAISIVAIGGAIIMTQQKKPHPHKIYNDLFGKNQTIEDFDYFLDDQMKKKILTTIDKDNLVKFIEINLDVLSGKTSLENIDDNNQNIQVELFAPKLPTTPVTWGSMTYTYIIKHPTQTSKGSYGDFTSYPSRTDENTPWQFSSIPIGIGYKTVIKTNFDLTTYNKLELKLTEKFFLSDLATKKHIIDFSPNTNFDKFINSDGNGANYAFYKFSTVKNSIPITVVFGVQEGQYNEHETVPQNWFYVYMKREGN